MFHSGEQARWREDGQLELRGPRESALSRGGRRADAREIERVLGRHPDVREVAVTLGAGGVTACVVAPASHGSLEAHARHHLPPPLVPSTWVRLDALPRTPDGRLDRSALPGAALVSASRRRPLESVLARLCKEVLDVSRVDPHEDFFELGGDSLAAARLIERIRGALGRQVDAGQLLAAPTVAGLAALLERTEAPQPASLVALQPLGSRPPLYCVHPASGSVIPYQALAARLGTRQPVYGLQASGLYGRRAPLRSVEDMAEAYLAEMRGVQSRGPWHLAGFGFGAVIAFEMAVRLRLAGDEVGLVAVVDGPCPSRGPARGGALSYRAGWWLSRGRRPVPGPLRWGFFREHHRALVRAWEPSFYPGRITAVQTLGRFPDASLGWQPHAASVEPIEVRVQVGRHRALLEEPAVHAVARMLAERIDWRAREEEL